MALGTSCLTYALTAFVLICVPHVWGAENVSGSLEPMIGLESKLSRAVCDESIVSHAPTLESLRKGPEPEGMEIIIKSATKNAFDLSASVSEKELIAYMLGDRASMIAAARFYDLLGKHDRQLEDIRRQVSLDLCTSLVSPGGLKKLLAGKHELLLAAKKADADQALNPDARGVSIRIRDTDGRFGEIGGRWWVPGWIEPYEVQSAMTGGKTSREYRRLANPITNRLQLVAVMGPRGVPLGFIFPTNEVFRSDWELLKSGAGSDTNRSRQFETYRILMEFAAYEAVGRNPKNAEAVRNLQEFYKNLLGAYRIFPSSAQFSGVGKNTRMLGERDLRRYINDEFLKTVAGARVNGAPVEFGLFAQDKVLQGLYEEYKSRLEKVR
jgi:hypothetical protein